MVLKSRPTQYFSDKLFRSAGLVLLSTVLVVLSMRVFLMYECFQGLGCGHLHAFVDGEVWRKS
jgi:hypothetical protein